MRTIFMASLGCAKNLVDAETMLGETLGERFGLALAPEEADVIIVNTCGFIEDAREEGRQVIRDCLGVKKRSGGRIRVVAAGCWAQRDPEGIAKAFPALDAVWGLGIPSGLERRLDALFGAGGNAGAGKKSRGGEPRQKISIEGIDDHRGAPRAGARLVTTLPSFAYLRLSDGCDNRCAYCAIPLIRGGLRSRAAGEILDEAKSLEDQGAREIVVIGQDTTVYGADLGAGGADRATKNSGLGEFLRRLLDAVAVPRVRLLYAHPSHLSDEVIDLLLSEPRLCGYLDLPVQHAADSVLRAMGRGYGRERIDSVLSRFAGRDFTLRTTFLLGFPGETEEDFGQVLELVGTGAFRHAGAFAYSPEPGTPAFGLPGAVPAAEAARRRDAVMAAQAENAFRWLDSRVGGVEEILVDSVPERGWLLGRSRHEAPDADGAVYIKNPKARPGAKSGAEPGDLINACVAGREGYDLFAEVGKRQTAR